MPCFVNRDISDFGVVKSHLAYQRLGLWSKYFLLAPLAEAKGRSSIHGMAQSNPHNLTPSLQQKDEKICQFGC